MESRMEAVCLARLVSTARSGFPPTVLHLVSLALEAPTVPAVAVDACPATPASSMMPRLATAVEHVLVVVEGHTAQLRPLLVPLVLQESM